MFEKIKGVIVDYNPEPKKRIGKLVDESNRYFFFHQHGIIKGEPRIGADVLFVISSNPVKPGLLPVAYRIEVIPNIVAGMNALAKPNEKDTTQEAE